MRVMSPGGTLKVMRKALLLALLMGCGSSDEPLTKGVFCDEMGGAVCARVASCGLDSFNACFQPFKASCCINSGTCAQPVKDGGRQVIDNCASAMPAASCQDLSTGVIPAACWRTP